MPAIEKCAECGGTITPSQKANVLNDRVLCDFCYQSAKNSAATQRRPSPSVGTVDNLEQIFERAPVAVVRAAPSAVVQVPKYVSLYIAAFLVMLLGGSIGMFLIVAGFVTSFIDRQADGFSFLGYGIAVVITTTAIWDLMLAVRHIAINSFHVRNALAK